MSTKLPLLTEQNVRRNTVIQIIIVTLAFIFFARIWPMGLVEEHETSLQQAMTQVEYSQADSFVKPDKKLQGVQFLQEHLYQITLYMSCMTYEKNDYVIFRLYNDKFSCIYEEKILCNQVMRKNALIATPDMDVVVGQDYYYEILIPEYDMTWRTVTEQLILPIAEKEQLVVAENRILYIDGIYNDKEALIADFHYTNPLPVWKIILAGLFVIVVSLGSYFGITLLLDRFWENLIRVRRYIRYGATGFVSLVAIAIFGIVVVWNVFGGATGDRIVYGIATVTAWFWGICCIWMPKTPRIASDFSVKKQASTMWRSYLQVMSFGLAVHSLCQYVNACNDYTHITNTRWMLIFFGIALLLIQTEKELCNIFSYIWLALSLIGSVLYCIIVGGDSETGYVAKLTAAVVVVWGLVLINVLLHLKKNIWTNISKPIFVIWCIYSILMIYWRWNKTWVYVAILPFAVVLLYNLSASARNRLLKNLVKGIYVSFVIYLIISLLHRPYIAWYGYRYSGMFHTVACTGMYLGLVAATALGRVYGVWKTGERLFVKAWKDIFWFAISTGCILLTMSRTAMLTLAVNFAMVFLLAAFVYKKHIKWLVKELGILLAAVCLCFPFIFSMTRMVPAVVNDPIYYEIENIRMDFNVQKGDAIDNTDKYMSINRYLAVMLGRFQIASIQMVEDSAKTEDDVVINIQESVTDEYADEKEIMSEQETEQAQISYVVEVDEDITSGRSEIYEAYWNALDWEGHEIMTLTMSSGNEVFHAHNSYLQVAYDFGILAGIAFLVLCALTLWRAVLYVYKYGKRYSVYMVIYSLVITFGVMSVTEWAYHPCLPSGFLFLFIQILLMQNFVVKNK